MTNQVSRVLALLGVVLMLFIYPSVVIWAGKNHAELLGLEMIPLVLGALLIVIAGAGYLLRSWTSHHPRQFIED